MIKTILGCSVLVVAALVLHQSCRGKETVPMPNTLAFDYFPLEKGHYTEYDVEETFYNITSIDRKQYQLKISVVDTFSLLPNEPVNFRLETYVRNNVLENWRADSVWSAQKLGQHLIFNRNNLPIVVLRNPLQTSNVWNGNLFNNRNSQNFRYSNINRRFLANNGLSFENTVTVTAERTSSRVDKRFSYDVLAKDVGLVYHHREFLNYEQNLGGGAIRCDSVIQFGSKVIWKMRAYGKD